MNSIPLHVNAKKNWRQIAQQDLWQSVYSQSTLHLKASDCKCDRPQDEPCTSYKMSEGYDLNDLQEREEYQVKLV